MLEVLAAVAKYRKLEENVQKSYKELKVQNLPAKSLWKKLGKIYPTVPIQTLKNMCAKAS